MWQPIAVALCCLRKVWKVFFVRIIVSRSHSGEVYKLVEKFKPPGIVTPAGGSGYKVIISFLKSSDDSDQFKMFRQQSNVQL